MPFEVPCVVNGKPVGGFFRFALALLPTMGLFRYSPLRSSPARSSINQSLLITRDASVTTMRLTRKLSAMLSTVPLLRRKSGRLSLGTIGRLFSSKPRIWLAGSIGTSSWPLQCSDRVRMLGRLKSMRLRRSGSSLESRRHTPANPLSFSFPTSSVSE